MGKNRDDLKELLFEAIEMIRQSEFKNKQISVSMLQRKLRIGYNRAMQLIDIMEEGGIIEDPNPYKLYRISMSKKQLKKYLCSF